MTILALTLPQVLFCVCLLFCVIVVIVIIIRLEDPFPLRSLNLGCFVFPFSWPRVPAQGFLLRCSLRMERELPVRRVLLPSSLLCYELAIVVTEGRVALRITALRQSLHERGKRPFHSSQKCSCRVQCLPRVQLSLPGSRISLKRSAGAVIVFLVRFERERSLLSAPRTARSYRISRLYI